MAVEDFTTYTLTTGGGTIGVTSTRATATSFQTRNSTGMVQKDKGASHFSGDFSHLMTITATVTPGGAVQGLWMLSNGTGDLFTMLGSGFGCSVYIFDSDLTLTLRDAQSGNQDTSLSLSASTVYYLTIARVSGVLTCKVYSDSGRSTLLGTATVNVTATAYRYVAVAYGYNDGSNSNTASSYVENLDLQEGGATGGGPLIRGGQLTKGSIIRGGRLVA